MQAGIGRHHPYFPDAGAGQRPHIEVKVAQELLQTMGLPRVRAAGRGLPGWRAHHLDTFQELRARHPGLHPRLDAGLEDEVPGCRGAERRRDPGCIVTAQARSKHALSDSLPGTGETPAAPVFIDGKKAVTLGGRRWRRIFQEDGDRRISRRRYGAGAGARTAAE